MILICKRKSKAALIEVYHQVETMKVIHNKLSEDIMIIQKELKEQRHLLANTAHDLKMVSAFLHLFFCHFALIHSFVWLFIFFQFQSRLLRLSMVAKYCVTLSKILPLKERESNKKVRRAIAETRITRTRLQ
jgi:hypothetical protein